MDSMLDGVKLERVKVRACALWRACRNVYDIRTAPGSCDQHKYLHVVSVPVFAVPLNEDSDLGQRIAA